MGDVPEDFGIELSILVDPPKSDMVDASVQSSRYVLLPDGTLLRPKSMEGTVWIDDMYKAGPFLVRWSKYTGENRYLDDAARQIINMARRL